MALFITIASSVIGDCIFELYKNYLQFIYTAVLIAFKPGVKSSQQGLVALIFHAQHILWLGQAVSYCKDCSTLARE